jgi:hypothetical protein
MKRKSEFNFLSISFMFRWESILQKCSESDAKRCGVDCLGEAKVELISRRKSVGLMWRRKKLLKV